jgi:5'-methylthioadenosine phosphorylase
VTVEMVVATLRSNVAIAKDVARRLARSLPDVAASPATGALRSALMTAPEAMTEEARVRLDWLLGPRHARVG